MGFRSPRPPPSVRRPTPLAWALAWALAAGCATTKTMNLQPHVFNKRADRMIWIMVDGLGEEHLSLLRFGAPAGAGWSRGRTSLERALCFGKAWSFNLFALRPPASSGFLSQATGAKNTAPPCGGFAREPIWNVFRRVGYRTAILESGVPDDESFARSGSCGDGAGAFLAGAALIRMAPAPGGGMGGFHHQDAEPSLRAGEVLHDRSCGEAGCSAGLAENAGALWGALGAGRARGRVSSILVVRVGGYAAALRGRDMAGARRVLEEVDALAGSLMDEPDVLVLVTSSGARSLEFPEEGPAWGTRGLGGVVPRGRRALMSPVWARGPGAENFCGLYEESDVFNRILWRPRRPFLERLLVPDS